MVRKGEWLTNDDHLVVSERPWFAWAWKFPGKSAQSLKTPWKWLFPWKVLEFVEMVLEFYPWTLKLQPNKSFSKGKIEHILSRPDKYEKRILKKVELLYMRAIHWILFEVLYLSNCYLNGVPEMYCVAPPPLCTDRTIGSVAWGVKFMWGWIQKVRMTAAFVINGANFNHSVKAVWLHLNVQENRRLYTTILKNTHKPC